MSMKFFIDTANIDEIRKASNMGIICGVIMNPSLIVREGRDFRDIIKEITEIVDGPISRDVKSTTTSDIIKEGIEIAAIHPNMVVKIPMTKNGLEAVKELSSKGIKTNVTLVFSVNQALLAAQAGAYYVSPFLDRMDNIGTSGINLIDDIIQIFKKYKLNTKIIAASINNPIHVMECAMAGAHIATVPYFILKQMTRHLSTTDTVIEKLKRNNKVIFGK